MENVEIYGMGALRTYANDCQLKNITVHGMHQRRGGDLEMNGGSAVNVRIQKFGDLYANGNSTIQELSLEEGAFAHFGHASIVGMRTASGSLFVYEDKSILKGNIALAGAAIGNGTGHSIIGNETSLMFDISSLTPSFVYSFPNIFLKHGLRQKTQTVKANAMLNKLDAFSGAGGYFINVSSKQEIGTYTLCEDANGFGGKIALLVGGQDTGEVFIVPEGIEGSSEIKHEGVTYALKKRNGVLELIVERG